MDSDARADRRRIVQLRLTNFLHGASGATLGFNVLFLKTQGLSPSTVGIIMGINAIVGAVSPPLWGIFADRIQSKYKIFLYTILGACAVSVLIPVSAYISVGGVILATALIPFMSFFRMPSQAMIDAVTVNASTIVQGMEYSNVRYWMSIGFTMMSFGYSFLVSLFGVAFPFYAYAFFTALLYMSRKTLKQYDVKTEHKADSPDAREGLQLSRLFKNYYLMVFLVLNIVIMVPQNCGMLMPYMLSAVGANSSLIGTITGVRVCGEILVLVFSHKIRRVLTQPVMMAMAVLCSLVELIGYQFAAGFAGVAGASFFGGAYFGFILSTGFNYVNNLAPQGLKATAISLYSIGGPVAGVIVNFIGGQIITYQGIRTLYLYAAACMVLWLVVFVLSYYFGEKVLKKPAPMPLFRRA